MFLGDLQKRHVAFDRSVPFTPIGLYLGQGAMGLEVVVVEAARKPAASDLRAAWKLRHRGRAAPVLLAALSAHGVSLCGPAGDEPPVTEDIDTGQAERLCREALAQPDRHAALRFLSQAMPSLQTRLPGIRNEGLRRVDTGDRKAPLEGCEGPSVVVGFWRAVRRRRKAAGTPLDGSRAGGMGWAAGAK